MNFIRQHSTWAKSCKRADSRISADCDAHGLTLDVTDRHVLIVDDILDTGKTLSLIAGMVRGMSPASLRVCVLLDKKGRRQIPFEADLVGFEIPDKFVVGYGLDFAERYRNLTHIGVLKASRQKIYG